MKPLTSVTVLNNKKESNKLINKLTKSKSTKKKLRSIISQMGFPITVIEERVYVDKIYRDIYYSVLSGKYFDYSRDCCRLSFFKNEYSGEQLWKGYKEKKANIENDFVGTMVLRPIEIAEIGRTLLDPQKLNISTAYIRTTTFTVEVLGMVLNINAFPFSEQDSEVMTCAETTIWAILEYYGTRYPLYRTVLPSDITKCVDSISKQRVMPSIGLDYYTVSMVLKKFGFQPKVFAKNEHGDMFQNIFHYYVESGIPVAVGTTLPVEQSGHSTVCIGHAQEDYVLPESSKMETYPNGIIVVDTCQFYSNYVIIDDNQIPYTIEPFDDFTIYTPAIVDVFVVPLYKRIYMDAAVAAAIFDGIIQVFQNEIKELADYYDMKITCDNPLVKRIFLTSSRRYIEYRTKTANHYAEAEFYANMRYPKFVWVMEISTFGLYKENKVIADVALDATSAKCNWSEYFISMRIMNHAATRLPKQSFKQLLQGLQKGNRNFENAYPIYSNNLKLYQHD